MTRLPSPTTRPRGPQIAARSGLPPVAVPTTPTPTPRAPEELAVALAYALLEFEAGRRPLWQFQRALSPALAMRLHADARRRSRRRSWPPPPTLATVGPRLVDHPSPDVCEVALVLRTHPRASVLAVRLERHRQHWRAVELARP